MRPQIWSFDGQPGSMKTSYALTFPNKIAVYDWDMGVDRGYQFESLESDGRVVVRDLARPLKSMTKRYAKLEGYTEAWAAFLSDLNEVLEDKDYSTIVFDTSTMLWKLCCDAVLQGIQEELSLIHI